GGFKWAYDLGGRIYSGPAVASDGTGYLGAENGRFAAVSASGAKVWEFVPGGSFLATSPVMAPDGTIYVGNGQGMVFALRGSAPPAASPWPMFRRDALRRGAADPSGLPVITSLSA